MKNKYILFLKEEEVSKLKKKKKLKIPEEEKYHIHKVLRKKLDFELLLGDGKGSFSKAVLNSNGLIQDVDEWRSLPKSTFDIALMLSPIKRVCLEWTIQKASELGVSSIYLIQSAFQRAYPPKKARLEKIIKSACSQSQNFFLPKLQILDIPLTKIPIKKEQFFFWGDLGSEATIDNLNISYEKTQEMVFINGPEGGWDTKERDFLRKNFPCISLSKNILRAETAVVCALYHAKLLYS